MSAQYSVIRYVPDPIAEEAVNIGIVTWDRDHIHCQFLENWARVRSFGTGNIDFLRDFSKQLSEATTRQLPLAGMNEPPLSIDALEKMVANWGLSIQFSAPRGSIKDAEALLSDVAPLFLRQARRARARGRTRVAAARQAATILLDAVRQRMPAQAEELVKTGKLVDGAIERHRLDVALANGHLLAGVQAMSFEIHDGEHLQKEILSAKWTLSDIRKQYALIPMAVFAYPPRGATARGAFRDARRALRALGAEVVITPDRMTAWANERAQAIHPE